MNAPQSALMKVDIPALAMSEPELISVLKTSIYPGAEDASIKLVIGYCRAAHLDPLQKPVHIVPMDVKISVDDKGKPVYGKRDVIMPGIGLYRVNAARTDEYAGMSEPEFGEMKDLEFESKTWEGSGQNRHEVSKKASIKYPEWCKVTVRRMVGGQVVDFTAKEYWLENYATAGNWTEAPNKMWKKRPMGQLAKCAEAQALRKAFPEVGAQPTAEEMDGKTIDADLVDVPTGTVRTPIPPLLTDAGVGGGVAPEAAETTTAAGDGPLLSDGERAHIKSKMEVAALTDVDLKVKFGVGLDGLKSSQFKAVKAWIAKPAG